METRIVPYSEDAERSVLGCMLISQEAANNTAEQLTKGSFYMHSHQLIFEAMSALYGQGKSIDMVTVTEELRSMGELSAAGGGSYIADLSNYVPSVANIENYIQIVKEKHIRREIIQTATEAAEMAYNHETEAAAILERTEAQFLSMTQSNSKQKDISFNDALISALNSIERAGKSGGIQTGFLDFDRMTTGLWPGEYMVLAARPSMGKTSLMLNIAYNVAVRDKLPVGVFSIEQDATQLIQRILSEESEVPLLDIRGGNVSDDQWEQIDDAVSRLKNSPLYINDTAATPFEIRSQARRWASRHGIKLLMVDYLQLMKTGGKPENRTNEVSEISRSFKLLAKELGIPVIVLSQLSRATEARQNKRPQLSDLRDSGAIEQDADIVTFLYRPDYYDKDKAHGDAEWIIEKQRNGPTGSVVLRWFPQSTTFKSAAKF